MVVKVVDKGFDKYHSAIKKLDSKKVAVGLFAAVGDEVLTKGIVNEFGTTKAGKNRNITIPERSYLRSTYNKNFRKVGKRFAQIMSSFSRGNYSVLNKLKLIGLEQENKVKETMTSLKNPPNAPSTIRAKGSSNPLIDTGELRSKISSEVRGRNQWAVLEER